MNSSPLSVSNPTMGEGQPSFPLGHRLDDPAAGPIIDCCVLSPPSEDVCDGESVNEIASQGCPAVQHQVCMNEPWPLFMLFTGFADLDRVERQ